MFSIISVGNSIISLAALVVILVTVDDSLSVGNDQKKLKNGVDQGKFDCVGCLSSLNSPVCNLYTQSQHTALGNSSQPYHTYLSQLPPVLISFPSSTIPYTRNKFTETMQTNHVILNLRGTKLLIERESLMNLPESIMLCLFPNGIILSSNQQQQQSQSQNTQDDTTTITTAPEEDVYLVDVSYSHPPSSYVHRD